MRGRTKRVQAVLGGQMCLYTFVSELPFVLAAAPGPFARYLSQLLRRDLREVMTSMPGPESPERGGGSRPRTSLFPLPPQRPWRPLGRPGDGGRRRRLTFTAGVWANLCVAALSFEAAGGGYGLPAPRCKRISAKQRRLECRIFQECMVFVRQAPSVIGAQVARRTLIAPFEPLL